MSLEHIARFELFAVDLPLRTRFKHAAAERTSSESIFLKCITESGAVGFGEALPRAYVTGEKRDAACALLAETILPRLRGRSFAAMGEVEEFLARCDGRAPRSWVEPDRPQSAAWCAVDLALLDAFGRAFGARPLEKEAVVLPEGFRYSGVVSADAGARVALGALKQRLFGLRELKLKVSRETTDDAVRRLAHLCGLGAELRVDVNMGWTLAEALERIPRWSSYGIASFEQPLAADDLEGASRLCAETGACLMADESFATRESLARLVQLRACSAVNARISKCGGLIATLARCREALDAGLDVQLGCQVGESSLLSSAQLLLASALLRVRWAEGCFGLHLLREDPGFPRLEIGFAGRAPSRPAGSGLGVTIDEPTLLRCAPQRCDTRR
jgi:muconate cycloisomerase